MGNEYPTTNHHLDKWLPAKLREQISDLKAALVILQNPFMRKPIEDIGLQDDTLAALKESYPFIKFGGQLVTFETLMGLNLPNANSILDIFDQHNLHIGDLNIICERQQLTDDIMSFWISEADPELMQTELDKSTFYTQNKLDRCETDRRRILDELHIVSIELPYTLKSVHNEETIKKVTRAVLSNAFSIAVQKTIIETIHNEVKDLPPVSWIDQKLTTLKDFTAKFLKPSEKPTTSFDRTRVRVFELEFAAISIPMGDTQKYDYRPINGIFQMTANKLSGPALAKTICARLEPQILAPLTPAQQALRQGHTTQDVDTPPWLLLRSLD